MSTGTPSASLTAATASLKNTRRFSAGLNKFDMAPLGLLAVCAGAGHIRGADQQFLFDYAIQGTNSQFSYIISTVFAFSCSCWPTCAENASGGMVEYRRRIVWSNVIIAAIGIIDVAFLISTLTISRARIPPAQRTPAWRPLRRDRRQGGRA
jgi:hypothetical protein